MQKKRIGRIGSAALALVMVLSFGLATPAPVVADVTQATVAVAPTTTDSVAQYTITFRVGTGLSADVNSIVITFPAGTTVPTTSGIGTTPGTVTVDATPCTAASVAGQVVTLVTPVPVTVIADCVVVFTVAAGVINPSAVATTYRLSVRTDVELTDVPSASYSTTSLPGPVDIYDANGVYTETSVDTITLALADGACVANGTLKVHDGTFREAVVIPFAKSGLTIESLNGADDTTIDASGVAAETRPDALSAVTIMGDDVKLGGDGKGFTIIAPNDADVLSLPQSYGVEVFLGCDRSHIEGNIIQGTAGQNTPQVGIHFWSYDDSTKQEDTTVKDNTITTTFPNLTVADWAYSSAGIFSYDLDGSNILIEGNTISGFTTGIQLAGLNATDADNPAVFYNNTVDGTLGLSCCTLEGSDLYVEVYENTFKNGGGYGLAITGDYAKVYKNDIYGNGDGVGVFGYTNTKVADIEIKYNNIYDNTNETLPAGAAGLGMSYTQTAIVCGVNPSGQPNLDVTHNCWDDPDAAPPVAPTGPLDLTGTPPGNPGGRCAKITVPTNRYAVDYSPWLYEPWGAVTPNSKPAYAQSVVLSNTGTYGWNTFSTPILLDSSYDSWAELYNLTGLEYLVAYYFDTATQEWSDAIANTSTYAITPCDALYIKMKTAGSLPICYSTTLSGLPTRSLPAGLALIGYASLDATMDVAYATASLPCTILTQVISPPQNTTTWFWACIEGAGSGKLMLFGEGYWATLVDLGGTYYGQSSTPQPWVDVP